MELKIYPFGMILIIFFVCKINFFCSCAGLKKYDSVVFTQRWPQAVCYKFKKDKNVYDCHLPNHDRWTIHGLWPTRMGQRGPVFCRTKYDFDIEKIDTIKDNLKENWTDFHEENDNDNDYYLWKQEWKKHGSCLVENNHQNTIFGYFKKGIDLLKNYQMKDILKKANIHPGNIYKILHVSDEIKKVLGKQIHLTWFRDSEKRKVYLEEISICMNRDMNFLIDCDGVGTLINSLPNLSLKYLDQTNEEIISTSTNKN